MPRSPAGPPEIALPPEETPTMVHEGGVRGLEFTPGTILLDRYRIISRLGKGGMGEVYRADDLKLGQPVALKFVVPRLAGQQQQLIEEVRVGRKVSHPNVCRLHDIGEIEGRTFLSMEYIDGEDLGSLLRRIGRLPHDKSLSLAREITAGVVAAHDCGIVHRDLKPANVMIDGRGTAHITDFGLARSAAADSGDTWSGTPPYMAPEQFTGNPASAASDVYALGLIFFELWTGRRLFAAASLPEIVKLHDPDFIRNSIRGASQLDPQIATIIETCLDENPARRPASARAVLALLPGRDALDASSSAGQTPSPSLVAAAADRGDLTRTQAWSLIAVVLATLAILLFIGERTALHCIVEVKEPRPVLQARAIGILDAIGWGTRDLPRNDSAGWFARDDDLLRWLEAGAGRRSASLARSILFAYRQSPLPMVSLWVVGNPMVTLDDPPMTVPGMARVVLDSRGRLASLAVLPPARIPSVSSPRADWDQLLWLAGFDAGRLTSVPPIYSAPMDNDSRAAWDGRDPLDGMPIHIEAAAWHGKPVWLDVTGEWNRRTETAPPVRRPGDTAADLIVTFVVIVVVVGSFLLVRRNLRRGQGDLRGATKLGVTVMILTILGSILRAHHASDALGEAQLGAAIFMRAIYVAFFMWIGYVAVEPLVRRRWPRALISWSRLLEGRFKDPMIGRDVLVGFLAAISSFIAAWITAEIVARIIGTPQPPVTAAMSALTSPRYVAQFLLHAVVISVTRGAGLLLILVLVRGVVRSQTATLIIATLMMVAGALPMTDGPLPMRLAVAVVVAVPPVVVIVRYGLLATCSMAWLTIVFVYVPLTMNPSSWHFGPSVAAVAIIVAVAIAAFYTSLGGKSPFAAPVFEE